MMPRDEAKAQGERIRSAVNPAAVSLVWVQDDYWDVLIDEYAGSTIWLHTVDQVDQYLKDRRKK